MRTVELDESWSILGKLHGGYLLATIVEAVIAQADHQRHPHPLAVSATYATAPAPGPAAVHVTPLKIGRSLAHFRANLEQDGTDCVQVFATLGQLPAENAESRWHAPDALAPEVAPLAACLPLPNPLGTSRPPSIRKHIDVRLEPASVTWGSGEPSGRADVQGWVRMITELDPVLAQFVLADAPPPVTFDLGLFGWVPTLQLQVLLRQLPPGGWQQVRQRALVVDSGILDEDCTLWDPRGRITVQARQLAAYRERQDPR